MKKTILIFAFLMASFVLFSQNNTVKEQNFANNSIQKKELTTQKYLNEMSLQQEKKFEDFLSKQSQQQNNNVKANIQDSLVLVALYDSTDGANWANTWDLSQPVSTWYGVSLDANGRVTVINLYSNQLSGSIPPEIGNLTNLQMLNFYKNQLSGSIPTQIGNLNSLHYLILSYNQLSGSIPNVIGNLTNLDVLALSNNQLSGTIPNVIGNLTNLNGLDLSNNQLNGTIPNVIGNLTNLHQLDLSNNQLNGTIPNVIGNLTNLHELDLSNNQLNGTIPNVIGNLTNLYKFDLSGNKLNGTIPNVIGNLNSLQYFFLSNNQLRGSIPSEIGNLTKLEGLDLSNNQLSDSIPSEIGNLTILFWIDLSDNQLSGSIPSSIGNLDTLYELDLSNNQLSGTIPNVIGNLTNLHQLYLSNNQLSGTVPAEIDSLNSLYETSLNDNNFVGLPDISSLSNLNRLYIYSNKLTFEDIEPNVGIPNFLYSPQAKVGSVQHYSPNVGDNLTLNVTVGGSANTYQWYKDGTAITSATNSSYTINNYNPAVDSAVYYCLIYNTIATHLALQSQNIYVGVAIPQYQISASINPSNSGTVLGEGTFDDGTIDTLIATANTGYYFLNWTQNGNIVSTQSSYIFTVSQDSNFIANFKLKSFAVSVTVNPSNSGTVTGDSTYDYGATATLIATPNTGYHFLNWTQNANEVSTDSILTFTVTQDSSFVSNFEASSSVMENSNSNISIYPNPANDKVNIISDDIYEISLYDISGKLITTENSETMTKQINVSLLKSGVYIIKLSNSENTYVYKIIKK